VILEEGLEDSANMSIRRMRCLSRIARGRWFNSRREPTEGHAYNPHYNMKHGLIHESGNTIRPNVVLFATGKLTNKLTNPCPVTEQL
jgi:hypothetical protein